MMITHTFDNHIVTYPVRAAEHVKYEYFILDMMIHGDTLLQFIVYWIFRIIINQLCVCVFSDDYQMIWIIINIISSICVFIEFQRSNVFFT